jgi:SAM-dependent methyltransferase
MSKLSKAWRGFLERKIIPGREPASLNRWQQAFCEWNAQRLGITQDESLRRFRNSYAALRGGHPGNAFRLFSDLTQHIHQVFFSHDPKEIHEAYQHHARLHSLRLLSGSIPVWPDRLPEIQPLFEQTAPVILDFGCGMAQIPISLALFLKKRGRSPELFLADIPTFRVDFLKWFCQQLGLPATFADCTVDHPIPLLPPCDLFIANEVFEHLHEPLKYLAAFDQAIKPGGYLFANLGDHDPEYFHVSLDLSPVRQRLKELGYLELRHHSLYQKP